MNVPSGSCQTKKAFQKYVQVKTTTTIFATSKYFLIINILIIIKYILYSNY